MFQLTTPLTPAPGRAGSIGVPGAGGAAGGGKSAIDLPDFMTFALSGAPAMAPGKARQDPAGGGDAVPGGAVLASPAGHPDGHAVVSGMTAALDLPIAAAKPADATLTEGIGEPVQADAPVSGQPAKVSARADDLPAATPKKTRPAPFADAPIRSDRPFDGAVKVTAKQRRSEDGNIEVAPADPDEPFAVSASFGAAPIQAAPAVLGPPAVEARAPTVGGSPDSTVSAAKTAPKPMDATVRTVERRRDTAGPIAITAPVMTAPSLLTPSIPIPAIPSALVAAPPALDPVLPGRVTGQPQSIAIAEARYAVVEPVPTTGPAAKPLAVTGDGAARPVSAIRGDSPQHFVPDDAAAVHPPAASALSGSLAPRPLLDAARPVGETRSRATQTRNTAGGVSLGTIAQMLGVVVPVQARAMPADYAPAAAAVSVEPFAPAAALPAMPASVATFLASVAPRSFAMPQPDALPDAPPFALPDALAKAASQPAAGGTTAVVSSPTVAVSANPAQVVIQSAGQLFAEAIHAATGQRERPYRGPVDDIVAAGVSAAEPASATTATVINRAPLDMTQTHWPMKMIERIEVLRDAADAQDTRIKLIPDALGTIDVSMRRDGDTVRVHLAAERPETRAMIADAQPRLAELGEQRGLKIAASSGQANGQAGAQDFNQPRGNPAPQQSARPASARAGDQSTQDDDGDQRVA